MDTCTICLKECADSKFYDYCDICVNSALEEPERRAVLAEVLRPRIEFQEHA